MVVIFKSERRYIFQIQPRDYKCRIYAYKNNVLKVR